MLAYYLLSQDRKARLERRRPNPLHLSNQSFKSQYRIDKKTFNTICDILKNDLRHGTNGFPVELQVLSTLRLLCSGSDQAIVADEHFVQLSQSTVSRNLTRVVDGLVKVMREHIKFPTTDQEQLTVKKEFFENCGIPNVLGVVDSLHIEIVRPSVADHQTYLNRKGTYSINVLLVCDAKGTITNIVARWPGSTKDSDVWDHSNLRGHLEVTSYNGYLLGDYNHSCDPWLVTPYRKPNNEAQLAFNERIKKARTVVERVSGMLKTKFRCLQQVDGGMAYNPKKISRIITACCVLHNICQTGNTEPSSEEAMPGDESQWPPLDLENEELSYSEQGVRLRDELASSLYRKHNAVVPQGSISGEVESRVQCTDQGNKDVNLKEQGSNLFDTCEAMNVDICSTDEVHLTSQCADQSEETTLKKQKLNLPNTSDAMSVDISSTNDIESRFQCTNQGSTLTEQESRLSDGLSSNLPSTSDASNVLTSNNDKGETDFLLFCEEQQQLREQGAKLRDDLASKLFGNCDSKNEYHE